MFGLPLRWGTWLVLPVCWAVLTALHSIGAFVPSNRWLCDHALHVAYRWHWADVARERGVYQQRPVFVQVDEASLRQLGRWPWSRSVHAQLLNRLNTGATEAAPQQTPAVVAWDVLFSEPQLAGVTSIASDEDADFAQALARSTFPVLLATQVDVQDGISRLIAPKAPIASTAAKMAHISIAADSDGTVRQYWPADDSMGVALPYLGSALAFPETASSMSQIQARLGAQPLGLPPSPQWLYPMPTDWVQPVSFASVWAGQVSPSVWAQQPVLIAAFSKGLGDQYVSPLYQPAAVINGGELILGAFHTEKLIAAGLPRLSAAPPIWQAWGVACVTLALFLALRRSARVRVQLLWVASSLALIGLLCLGVLMVWGVWINAVQWVFASMLVWVFWMSSKLQRLLQFVFSRLAVAEQAATLPIQTRKTIKPALASDVIEVQLAAMDVLEVRHQDEYARLNQVLELMPDATFVLNPIDGAQGAVYRVSLQNLEARRLTAKFPALGRSTEHTLGSMNTFLHDFSPNLTPAQHAALSQEPSLALSDTLALTASKQASFEWAQLLLVSQNPAFESGVLASSPQGQRYLIKLAHLAALPTFRLASDAAAQTTRAETLAAAGSAVLSIVDLSVSQALDENRERTLSFLSHDLRSPQSTILSLLALEREQHPELAEFFDSIQFQAHRTLHLAEGFVQWSQASHREAYQFMEYDLNELMIDALDELWASAKQKGVALNGDAIDHELWVMMDKTLLWRALVNIVSNALNACPAGSEIRLSTSQHEQWAQLVVQDNGPGIPLAAQAKLFEPFVQGVGLKRTGAGLGLAFVKTVMEQHHGRVLMVSPVPAAQRSAPNWPASAAGTRFELWLPIQAAPNTPSD